MAKSSIVILLFSLFLDLFFKTLSLNFDFVLVCRKVPENTTHPLGDDFHIYSHVHKRILQQG